MFDLLQDHYNYVSVSPLQGPLEGNLGLSEELPKKLLVPRPRRPQRLGPRVVGVAAPPQNEEEAVLKAPGSSRSLEL